MANFGLMYPVKKLAYYRVRPARKEADGTITPRAYDAVLATSNAFNGLLFVPGIAANPTKVWDQGKPSFRQMTPLSHDEAIALLGYDPAETTFEYPHPFTPADED